MSIKSELLEIQMSDAQHILRVQAVKAWARQHRDSFLYKSIEWDDKVAAERHRDWQIRQLIQLHIVSEDRTPLVVSLSIDRMEEGGGYRSISDVVKVPKLQEIMLADALAELRRMEVRYQRVTQLASVWNEADKVRQGPKRGKKARKLG